MDTDQSSTFLSSIQSEIAKYQLLIEEENQKLKRYKVGFCSVPLSLQLHAVFHVTFTVIEIQGNSPLTCNGNVFFSFEKYLLNNLECIINVEAVFPAVFSAYSEYT